MKTRKIIDASCRGQWRQSRTVCRGVIIRDGEILLSYLNETGQWMLPGGGQEEGEDGKTCCAREVAEETGYLVQVSECALEVEEYYEDWKRVTRYFCGKVTGKTEARLTGSEKEAGMEERWLPVSEIIGIYRGHAAYAGVDERRRRMYLRESIALCELIPETEREEGTAGGTG